jgi:hypothetical protein
MDTMQHTTLMEVVRHLPDPRKVRGGLPRGIRATSGVTAYTATAPSS